jgi:hypothetical protein
MPQLDKLIYFTENLGFILSFFSLVFYNQYIFYPNLLKNLFIKKLLILKNSTLLNINFFFKYNNLFILSFEKNMFLQNLFLKHYVNNFKKIKFYLNLKIVNYLYFINLFFNKFLWVFSFFYEVYRTYIVEVYVKEFE